jgi:hypothetical protein
MRYSTNVLHRLSVSALLAAVGGMALYVSSLSAQSGGTSIRQGPQTTIGPRPDPILRQGPELAITGPRPCDADPVSGSAPELQRLIRDLDKRIAGTERDIQKLGFKSSVRELDDWRKLAEEQHDEVIKKVVKELGGVAIGSFIKGIQATGVTSITPWSNSASVISRLRAATGIENRAASAAVQKAFESAAFRSLVRQVSLVPGKAQKVEGLETLLLGLKDIVFDDVDIATHPDEIEPILKAIVTIGQMALPRLSPVAGVFLDEIWVIAPTVYFGGSSAVTSLTNATEAQLNALKLAACDQRRFYETRRAAQQQLAELGPEVGPNVAGIVGLLGGSIGGGLAIGAIAKKYQEGQSSGGGSGGGGSCTAGQPSSCTSSSRCNCGYRCVTFDGAGSVGFCSP